MKNKGTKIGKVKFGPLKKSTKKGPLGNFVTRKINSGKNKGKTALWF